MWKCGLKWTSLREIKWDHTQQPWEAFQFRPRRGEALSRGELEVAFRKREGILPLGFSHLQPHSHVNVLSLSGFLFPVFSIFFSLPLAVLSPWESVSGPLGESCMGLHELLKLTKAYSFPINLPWTTCSSCEFPAWDVAVFLNPLHSPPKESVGTDTRTVKDNSIGLPSTTLDLICLQDLALWFPRSFYWVGFEKRWGWQETPSRKWWSNTNLASHQARFKTSENVNKIIKGGVGRS